MYAINALFINSPIAYANLLLPIGKRFCANAHKHTILHLQNYTFVKIRLNESR